MSLDLRACVLERYFVGDKMSMKHLIVEITLLIAVATFVITVLQNSFIVVLKSSTRNSTAQNYLLEGQPYCPTTQPCRPRRIRHLRWSVSTKLHLGSNPPGLSSALSGARLASL